MHSIFTTAFFVLSFLSFLTAQISTAYQPLPHEAKNLPALTQTLDDKLKKDLTQIKVESKAQKLLLEGFYTKRTNYVKKEIESSQFLFDTKLSNYFNNILQTIQTHNKTIALHDIRLFVSRSTEPNAHSVGEGTIAINIGLINELENESQIAFVLAHELAHYILNHSNEAMQTYVSVLEDEATASRLKKAAKQKYNSASKTMDVLQGIIYQHHKLSRATEISADSLALFYLLNTEYDARAAIRALHILDSVYQKKYADSLDLKTIFDLPAQPFKADWLKKEGNALSFSNQNEEGGWHPDSLETHPDCPERIQLLESYLENYKAEHKKNYLQSEAQFRDLVHIAEYETLESSLFFKDYGRCLYFATLLLQKNPEDNYVNGIIGKCFQRIHEAQVNHELGKYAELPAEYHPAGYRQTLTFIQNLRLKEIAQLANHFNQKAAN